MTKYWALSANPNVYRIEDAVRELKEDLWTARSGMSYGDQVLIWKAQGKSTTRGILCLGLIISKPFEVDDTDNRYWVDRKMGREVRQRVVVRYIHAPNLPLWLGVEADEVLKSLSVYRATGGSVFQVTPEQWKRVLDAAGGFPQGSLKHHFFWW